MENEILIDLMVQLAGLEAERHRCLAAMDRDARAADLLEGLQAEYASDADTAAGRLQAARLEQRRVDKDLAELERVLERKRGLLARSRDPRETSALQREIAGLETRQDTLLAEACRLLEQVEEQDRAARDVDAEALEQERRAVARQAEIAEEHARLASALPEIEAEILRLKAMVPPAVGRHLQRLWDRQMLASVYENDGSCSACGSRLTPQKALSVQHGRELVKCPACARFVVHKPWH